MIRHARERAGHPRPSPAGTGLYAGLMSGTSLDGIDVAVVAFEGEEERPATARLVSFSSHPYDEAFRQRLRRVCSGGSTRELCVLSFELGRRFAGVLLATLEAANVDPSELTAVGSHGQTVWHAPREPQGKGAGEAVRSTSPWPGGATLQIGESAVIVEETGVPVVEDFRVRDVAAGGQGAPLTAYFDRLLLSSPQASRAIVNLGGMGNVTALPGRELAGTPLAFDTGPGVALLDSAVSYLTQGARRMDEDGRWAASGTVSPAALAEWLEDPFFTMSPPRSTGRERFSELRLTKWLERHGDLSGPDLLATLTELTARSVVAGFRWIPFEVDEVYLCGGGARNTELRRRLQEGLAPRSLEGLERLGWDGDGREAAAFALLARQHVLGIPADLAWATGARGCHVLGKWVPR